MLDQLFYHQSLKKLYITVTFCQFLSMRIKLECLSNARPDLCVDISQRAQIKESVYSDGPKSTLERLNGAIKYANDYLVHMKLPCLNSVQ